jgi:hypothetical protein
MNTKIAEFRNIHVSYGEKDVLNGVDLDYRAPRTLCDFRSKWLWQIHTHKALFK